MPKNMYSKEAANLVRTFLEKDDWNFYFNEEKGLFRFDVGVEGKLNDISIIIHIALGGILFLAISPVKCVPKDEKMMARMAEYLTRINFEISMGNFEMDYDDGEIRYRYFIDTDAGLPNEGIMKDVIMTSLNLYMKIEEGLLGIIFKDLTAKEAYESWKNVSRSRYTRKIIEEAIAAGEDQEFIDFLESFLDYLEDQDDSPGELN